MENPISQKLDALQKLQDIDSKLDNITQIRGDLPEEVQDLEDEIIGYQTRVDKYNSEISSLEEQIREKETAIRDSKTLIARYEEQQMNVRNNREYDALTKEVELQDLEIQISQKRIKEGERKIEGKREQIAETLRVQDERKKDLESKKTELDTIISETEVEETKLLKTREKAINSLEERLYKSYSRIRKNARNGLAVVNVDRDACGGCFNMVPPQLQADIKDRKKLIICEHCGRILVDVIEVVVEEKPKRTTRKKKVATKKA